jgi:hypothetical protein
MAKKIPERLSIFTVFYEKYRIKLCLPEHSTLFFVQKQEKIGKHRESQIITHFEEAK